MRAYGEIFIKSFSRCLAYKSDVWLRVIGNIVTIFIQVSIWKAIIGDQETTGITLEDMITYSILTTSIMVLEMSSVLYDVDASLKSGSISIYLMKPISYPIHLFFEQLGNIVFRFWFTLVPTVGIAWLWYGLRLPESGMIIPFFLSLFMSIFLSFAFGYLVSLLGFWVMTTFSLRWIYWGLLTLFSGAFLPMWFYSGYWGIVAKLLPFQFLGFVPAAIFLGKLSDTEIVNTLLMGILWIVLIYIFNSLLWHFTIRKLVIQGG